MGKPWVLAVLSWARAACGHCEGCFGIRMSEVVTVHTVILWKALQDVGRVCAFLGVGLGGEKPALFMDGFHRGSAEKGESSQAKQGYDFILCDCREMQFLCQPVLGTRGDTVWGPWAAAPC